MNAARPRGTAAAWAELLRLPALLTVPGDVLAGAAAAGGRPTARTALAVGASLCLYEAGMALNDWADRDEDAVARPHRPIPSGRIRPGAALAAAGALTAAGLALAARAGRRPLAVATPLAALVWAYDLKAKHTAAGPAAMAGARALDLLLGAAVAGPVRGAALPAAVLGCHTCAVTLVSRREAEGGATAAPLLALAVTGAVTAAVTRTPARPTTADSATPGPAATGPATTGLAARPGPATTGPAPVLTATLAATYAATFARPLAHAALNPSPPLTQRAVGGGIRAVLPLQGALLARAGAPGAALLTAVLAPLAGRLARKVSTT
ncbi:SCO3242 family prenyltransferase [Streptomyces sp. NPDC049813]|uniref:SCO3242 family prenyltransferase n=1 Tax=Streptomyces sp. NPDC049813 TaxID=3365597 RepID=UPI0037B3D16A